MTPSCMSLIKSVVDQGRKCTTKSEPFHGNGFTRYFHFAIQKKLLEAFPVEGGKKSKERIIPTLPGILKHTQDYRYYERAQLQS